MEKEILGRIYNDLNWYERKIIKVFKKTFVNVYKKGVRDGFNW